MTGFVWCFSNCVFGCISVFQKQIHIFTLLDRSGNPHNHHPQQRMVYGQNRPNYHNGSHNMHNNHGVNSVATGASQQQPPSSVKIDANSQSNPQSRHKTIESANHQPPMTSNTENLLKRESVERTDGRDDDPSALNVIANTTSNQPGKTKTPMCIVNELVRANRVSAANGWQSMAMCLIDCIFSCNINIV